MHFKITIWISIPITHIFPWRLKIRNLLLISRWIAAVKILSMKAELWKKEQEEGKLAEPGIRDHEARWQ